MRVVSLLPSATEMLAAVLLEAGGSAVSARGAAGVVDLVGRSHECDWPVGVRELPALTASRTHGTDPAEIDRQVRERMASGDDSLYTLDAEGLAALHPDVILTQDLCEVCSIDVAAVRRAAARLTPPPRVVSFNPTTIEGVLDDVLTVARKIGLEELGVSLLVKLRQRLFAAADHVPAFFGGPTVAFLEWTDPLFAGGHWTPQLIERAGGVHTLNPTVPLAGAGAGEGSAGQSQRAAGKSVRVPVEVLVASRPEVVIVCPCGVRLEEALRQTRALADKAWWQELPAVRSGRVAVVDGNEMFNRPGPRLVDAFEFLVGFLNDRPEVIPPGFPWRHV